MILLWVGLVLAALALLRYAGRIADQLAPVAWPGEAPLNPHDDRARDPHLGQLVRLLAGENPGEAHHTVVDVTERLLTSGSVQLLVGSADTARQRLGPAVTAFLADPPLGHPDRYRRELAEVLTSIEAL